MVVKNKPNKLYIERIYDASVKMVWESWVDPRQVAQLWGPLALHLQVSKWMGASRYSIKPV